MLTFSFTGVEGSMTESEVLTSGMVGKEILLTFDQSWNGLTKTLVFRAGEATRVVLKPGTAVTVPADVLKRPFHRLYVGVYGTDAEGTLVIPTVMAEGPMIRYGADPIEDETAEELPVWKNLQNQIGDISALETDAGENLVAAVNELHRADRFMGDGTQLKTAARDTLVGAVNELYTAQTKLGDTAALETDAKSTLVAAVNELHRADSFMGEGSRLKTAARDTLVGAVNELYTAQTKLGDTAALETDSKSTLVAAVNELHSADSFMGEASQLKTQDRSTLVAAVNEVRAQVAALEGNPPLTVQAAQLLVDILSQGLYREDQSGNIAALAATFGVKVPENAENLVAYWDFRTGSLTDQVAGLEAVAAEGVTFDSEGAHITTSTSYITVPLGTDGATLAGNYIEVKFGEMVLTDTGTTMRLLTGNSGNQPATNGLMWTSQDCWSNKLTTTTDLTDMQMFSGQTVIGRPSEDETQILWYLGDRYLVPSNPSYVPTHVSVGASVNSAYPVTVEYIKIRPLE